MPQPGYTIKMTPIDISRFEQLKASGDLPSPKGVALAIIHMTQQTDVETRDLARLVQTDPAFVGRLIKAANAANGVGRRPVASVQDALLVLGQPAVRGLALGFSLVSGYGGGTCRNFDYEAYWSGSLVCAIAMQFIAQRTRATTPEEAFSAGLLARIGELALATLFPAEYSAILGEYRQRGDVALTELEQRELVMDHCELSAAMMADWGLPKVFFEPVYYHENIEAATFPAGSRPAVLARSLALARQIAAVCLAPDAERGGGMQRLFERGLAVGFAAEELTQLCDKVAENWKTWGDMLQLRTGNLPSFEDLARAPVAPPAREEAEEDTLRRDLGKLRVLVVDDDPVMRALVRKVVEKAGHEVFEAPDGKSGLDRALELRPQMMIVDWLMPEMDGMALTRALRQTRAGRGIYVLILTSLEDDEFLIEAFENGVDDYLVKPLKQRVLGARLRAGQRVVRLHQEIEKDREEIRRFAGELAVTNRRLQEAALTDPLTGLPNRRYAMERLQQEWSLSLREERPLACLVIDVDEFKPINDNCGHDVGDLVLRQAAAALKRGLREQDVLCRLGGDEFIAICPGTTLEQALICAERVRSSMEEALLNNGALKLTVTVSIGAAVRTETSGSVDALIKHADEALYLAKQRGRNCVATA